MFKKFLAGLLRNTVDGLLLGGCVLVIADVLKERLSDD